MKLKLLASIIAFQFIGWLQMSAQKVDWGDLQKHKSKYYEPQVLGEDEKSIYTYSWSKGDLFLEKFNKKRLTRAYSNEIEFEVKKKKFFEVENVALMDNSFSIFTSYYDKKKKEVQFYVYKANKKTGKLDKEKEALTAVKVEKKRLRGEAIVKVSENRKNVLFIHKSKSEKKSQNRIALFVLNEDLEILMEEEIVYHDLNDSYIDNFFIDNNGSVYFKEFKNNNHYITIYDADKEFEQWSEKIDISEFEPSARVTSMAFNLNAENHLTVTGYYAKNFELKGSFFMKIDNFSKEVIAQKISKFDETFVESFKSAKQKKKEARKKAKGKKIKEKRRFKVLDNFKNLTILPKKDGGVVMLGEFYQHTYLSNNGYVYGEVYNYGDIIALSFDKEGNMQWANRLPKQQVFSFQQMGGASGNGGFFIQIVTIYAGSYGMSFFGVPLYLLDHYSYVPILEDDKLSVAFLDHKKNLNKTDSDKLKAMGKPKTGVPTVYQIDLETGERKKKLYTDSKDFDVMLAPAVYYQDKQGSDMYVFGKNKKKFKFGRVKM